MMVSTVNAQAPSPQDVLIELEAVVQDAPDYLFRGYAFTYTKQLKDALVRKIDAVITMMDNEKYEAAINKLENDIAHKLTVCDTQRIRALSWLSYAYDYEVVSAFAEECQVFINDAINLASQR